MALLIRRLCSRRPPTLASGGAGAEAKGGTCGAFCRVWSDTCARPSTEPVQLGSRFGHSARTETGLRAHRLDRTLSEIEAGWPSVTLPLIRVADQSNVLHFKKVLMTRTLTNVQARMQSVDRRRRADGQRGNVEVRRVAVVHPGGSHFTLQPVRASLPATNG